MTGPNPKKLHVYDTESVYNDTCTGLLLTIQYLYNIYCCYFPIFRGLCLQGVMSAGGFIQGVMSTGGFVRMGFCPRFHFNTVII